MNYQDYYIPVNFTDAGKLAGLFPIRNTIEALLLALPAAFCCFVFLPFDLTTKIMVSMIADVPLGGFALIGVQDDCLSRFLWTWWRWRRRRGILTYRGTPAKMGRAGR